MEKPKYLWLALVVLAAILLSGYAAVQTQNPDTWYTPLLCLGIAIFFGGANKLNRMSNAFVAFALIGLSAFLLYQNIPNIDWTIPLVIGMILTYFAKKN